MQKKSMVFGRVGLALTILFCAINLLSVSAAAGPMVVAVEGVKYSVNASLADNLKFLLGKEVYVTLASGKTFAGSVKEVGEHLLHLEKLEGKNYFDALINIEDISAIDTRFREVKR